MCSDGTGVFLCVLSDEVSNCSEQDGEFPAAVSVAVTKEISSNEEDSAVCISNVVTCTDIAVKTSRLLIRHSTFP